MNWRDLQADVWIAASEISERRGKEIDFADENDQELVLSRVFSMARKQSDWRLRSSLSIDADYDGNLSWAERIPEPVSTDPILILLRLELATEQAAKLNASYSQAKAYFVALGLFNHDQSRLSAFLVIAPSTLRQRMRHAINVALRQPSLFDPYERIDEDFAPAAGRAIAVSSKPSSTTVQAELQL